MPYISISGEASSGDTFDLTVHFNDDSDGALNKIRLDKMVEAVHVAIGAVTIGRDAISRSEREAI